MADEGLPLLRGRITDIDTYQAPQRPIPGPQLPSLEPRAHRHHLLTQLDAIERQLASRPEGSRDEAAIREIAADRISQA